mmetsp:Transcript_30615/g.88332  ORF Transcript_30615/g.88332 Transcript_30615/m.88332 type:complete len:400 (-) Transcript_30615:356-1555(-)
MTTPSMMVAKLRMAKLKWPGDRLIPNGVHGFGGTGSSRRSPAQCWRKSSATEIAIRTLAHEWKQRHLSSINSGEALLGLAAFARSKASVNAFWAAIASSKHACRASRSWWLMRPSSAAETVKLMSWEETLTTRNSSSWTPSMKPAWLFSNFSCRQMFHTENSRSYPSRSITAKRWSMSRLTPNRRGRTATSMAEFSMACCSAGSCFDMACSFFKMRSPVSRSGSQPLMNLMQKHHVSSSCFASAVAVLPARFSERSGRGNNVVRTARPQPKTAPNSSSTIGLVGVNRYGFTTALTSGFKNFMEWPTNDATANLRVFMLKSRNNIKSTNTLINTNIAATPAVDLDSVGNTRSMIREVKIAKNLPKTPLRAHSKVCPKCGLIVRAKRSNVFPGTRKSTRKL